MDQTFESKAPVKVSKEKSVLRCAQARSVDHLHTSNIHSTGDLSNSCFFRIKGPHKLPRRIVAQWSYLMAAIVKGKAIVWAHYLKLDVDFA